MPGKTAYIIDTNFIIENHDLEEVCEKLSDIDGILYVTQVAIDERIAQECIKQKHRYEKIEKLRKETEDIAEIKISKTYDDVEKQYRDGMQQRYEKLLGGRIIPLQVNEDTFRSVLNRAYMKVPPFISAGTDKGFKDSLMWLSVVEYFKSHGEEKIVFISNDHGFLENKDLLITEFEKETNKKIEFKENKYYKELFVEAETKIKEQQLKTVPDMGVYRDRIRAVVDDIRIETVDGYFGPEFIRTFTTSKYFDEVYVEEVFSLLDGKIIDHIFDHSVSAKEILDLDDRITNGDIPISISSLEKVYNLYLEISKQYPEYLSQFYSAVANVLNLNYYVEEVALVDDEDIPF